ncbi:MAG: tRNA (adenosine(37)-N6)-threonylcarbamoyltransferase complex dimerization subunit type 1 TsaB [Chitinispirillaceae bacterium]|nr:tRNA (adenosine(37)-N6)-threonylcarbamoyltransferase complex dimerization subunit type 1 TsaB [Chitinispirillaceae bacterium]
MNWILGIDTSSTGLSVGLFRNSEPMASYSRCLRSSHAEHIAQAVTFLLCSCGVSPADVTHAAVAAGPGSFTGLRIGLAFAKGFCATGAVTVLPVSSLFVLAHGASGRAASVVSAIDARRGEVFWARFGFPNSEPVRATADTAGTAEEFRHFLQPGDAVVFDTLGYARSTVFNFLEGRPGVFPARRFPVERGLCCAAAGAAAVNDTAAWKNAPDVLPGYLRPFTSPAFPKVASTR